MLFARCPPTAGALVLAALAVCSWSTGAHACSVCGSDDPLVAVGDSAPNAGALRLALSLSIVSATAQSDDDPGATEKITRRVLTPTVVYSPLERLNLAFSLPLLRNRFEEAGPDDQLGVTLTGLGDAELGMRYFAWQAIDFAAQRRAEFAFSGGASLPTGANDAKEAGARLDEHAQLGRGAFGPHLGALAALHQGPWHFSVDTTLRAYTTNHYDYRYGAAALWNTSAQLSVGERLAFEAGLSGRYAAHDARAAETQQNTGGFVLQAVPGVSAELLRALWLKARVELPFVKDLFGVQTLGPTFTVSAQWAP